MRPYDVPGEWVDAALNELFRLYGHRSNDREMRAAIAAVAPLIAKAERERCLTAVCTRQPLGPTIDRAETLAAIRALPDA